LRGASLEESYCVKTRFDGAILQDVIFQQGIFNGANFKEASIIFPVQFFSELSFKGADFTGAKIEDRKFSEYLRNGGGLNVQYLPQKTPSK